jgi:hypothetical protein
MVIMADTGSSWVLRLLVVCAFVGTASVLWIFRKRFKAIRNLRVRCVSVAPAA